jgi:hypothetical protein
MFLVIPGMVKYNDPRTETLNRITGRLLVKASNFGFLLNPILGAMIPMYFEQGLRFSRSHLRTITNMACTLVGKKKKCFNIFCKRLEYAGCSFETEEN